MLALRSGCEERCPGCSHRSFTAEKSEKQKSDFIARTLEAETEPLRSVSDEARWGYREKTVLSAAWSGESWNLGLQVPLQDESRDYEVIAIPDCPVHSERIRKVVRYLSQSLPRPESLPLVFVGMTGALLTLVLKEKPPQALETETEKELKELISSLIEDKTLDGVFLNYNPVAGGRVFSSRGWKLILGTETSVSRGITHGPESFQQLIPALYEDAIAEASAFFDLRPGDLVLDLYCGLGISVSRWVESGAQSVGIDLVGEAIRCAQSRVNAVFLQGRVSDRIPQLDEALDEWKSRRTGGRLFVFSNPPRTGMESEVIDWIGKRAMPGKLVYLSCSARTLGRDLSALSAYGLKRIIPYDFFPQTFHVEALACLELGSASVDASPPSV